MKTETDITLPEPVAALSADVATKILPNGIVLPAEWPPRNLVVSPEMPAPDLGKAYGVDDPRELSARRPPAPVPYLENPPAVLPINVGRQLFVDDFLIERTNLARTFHLPEKHPANPVFAPVTPLECPEGRLAGAAPKSGAVWWDDSAGVFKMWYETGWCERLAFATSRDGLHWERPVLDAVHGDNRIADGVTPDSTTVFIDHVTDDPTQRYKMLVRSPGSWGGGLAMVSADGIHWSAPVKTGLMNDRSTMFYNPFLKKWVYSIRSLSYGRTRHYREHDDFLAGATWTDEEPAFWATADDLDPADPEVGYPAQLYNLDAVAYESIMLGVFEILLGPNNRDCAEQGRPKITDLTLAYSRDGFHWHRPDRRAFIASSRSQGTWDRGYVQSVGGVCAIVGDELWFYYSAAAGGNKDTDPEGGMYANRATGVARLRRDGFASMDAGAEEGTLLTRPLLFSGESLWVNVACADGELRAEILEEDGTPVAGLGREDCVPVRADSTKTQVMWTGGTGLDAVAGRPVRIRFYLRSGSLYAFWVSADPQGASNGYAAAGGPGYSGGKDQPAI
ncbi:MAG: glycosyl hydrolase family 32 [Verrucomicrobiota bacterium]